MSQITVAPARDGLLVPFEVHRPGQFIGVRHARETDAPESIVATAPDGHAYAKNTPPYAVVMSSPYYLRRIAQKDLVVLTADEVLALTAAPAIDEPTATATSRRRSA